MSRSGLFDSGDIEDTLEYGRWRGAVASAIRGKKGQEFLREMLAALDALEERRLIATALDNDHGEVCALGSVGKRRGLDMSAVDVDDPEAVSSLFGINEKLAQEIMWINDEWVSGNNVPAMQKRYEKVRGWVLDQIRSRGELVPSFSLNQGVNSDGQ